MCKANMHSRALHLSLIISHFYRCVVETSRGTINLRIQNLLFFRVHKDGVMILSLWGSLRVEQFHSHAKSGHRIPSDLSVFTPLRCPTAASSLSMSQQPLLLLLLLRVSSWVEPRCVHVPSTTQTSMIPRRCSDTSATWGSP